MKHEFLKFSTNDSNNYVRLSYMSNRSKTTNKKNAKGTIVKKGRFTIERDEGYNNTPLSRNGRTLVVGKVRKMNTVVKTQITKLKNENNILRKKLCFIKAQLSSISIDCE